jgi:hypothetical protein
MIKFPREFRGIIDMIYVKIKQEKLDIWVKSPTNQFYGIKHKSWSDC